MGRRRPGKQLFSCYQRRGEWVELLFMTVASGLGFNVFKPWGEPPRYDVVIEHQNRFLRIQVKSTEMWLGTCYLCQLHNYGCPRYTTKNVDYFAIYVFTEDVWYIFPAKELVGKRNIALAPHLKVHKYRRFMENWWLLTRPHPKHKGQTQIPTEEKRTAIHRLTQRILKRMEGRNH